MLQNNTISSSNLILVASCGSSACGMQNPLGTFVQILAFLLLSTDFHKLGGQLQRCSMFFHFAAVNILMNQLRHLCYFVTLSILLLAYTAGGLGASADMAQQQKEATLSGKKSMRPWCWRKMSPRLKQLGVKEPGPLLRLEHAAGGRVTQQPAAGQKRRAGTHPAGPSVQQNKRRRRA